MQKIILSDWLALDEPFTGLDAANRDDIVQRIKAYAATRPVVMVTHHPEEIAALNAKVIELA